MLVRIQIPLGQRCRAEHVGEDVGTKRFVDFQIGFRGSDDRSAGSRQWSDVVSAARICNEENLLLRANPFKHYCEFFLLQVGPVQIQPRQIILEMRVTDHDHEEAVIFCYLGFEALQFECDDFFCCRCC